MGKKIIQRKHIRTLELFGEEVKLELGMPRYEDAPELIRRSSEFRSALAKTTATESGVEFGEAFKAMEPDFVRRMFERYAKPAEPLEDEEGNALTTGLDLFAIAPLPFVVAVVRELNSLAMLTDKEGKASGSPSTSTAEPPESSGSAATSTAQGDGPSA